jgi:hypothetical protein
MGLPKLLPLGPATLTVQLWLKPPRCALLALREQLATLDRRKGLATLTRWCAHSTHIHAKLTAGSASRLCAREAKATHAEWHAGPNGLAG